MLLFLFLLLLPPYYVPRAVAATLLLDGGKGGARGAKGGVTIPEGKERREKYLLPFPAVSPLVSLSLWREDRVGQTNLH